MKYKEYLNTLSKNEKRYLANFECFLCEHPLNRDGCSGIWCTDETRINRSKKCLENYKPKIVTRTNFEFEAKGE